MSVARDQVSTTMGDTKARLKSQLRGSALAAAYNNHAVILSSLAVEQQLAFGDTGDHSRDYFQKAVENFGSALELDDSRTIPLANLGMLLLSDVAGKCELATATKLLQKLVERSPRSPQAHHALASAFHRQALSLTGVADAPLQVGEQDQTRQDAVAQRAQLLRKAVAQYRQALTEQSDRCRKSYSQQLNDGLRQHRGVCGIRPVAPPDTISYDANFSACKHTTKCET